METILKSIIDGIVREGHLEVSFASGKSAVFGDGTGSPVAISFLDKAAEWRCALRPSLAFGELIVDERIRITTGTLRDLLDVASRNIGTGTPRGLLSYLTPERRLFTCPARRNTVSLARKNVAHHYGLNHHFYQLFLDDDLQYSCAYFSDERDDLEAAQLAKKRHIAAKLLLANDQHTLDIGSGWGGLAIYLAKCCHTHVTGITLSREQLEIARRRADEEGLGARIEFRLADYRDVRGRFDRIVSVGMFEHVGARDYQDFFMRSYELLGDEGIMLLHTIGRSTGPAPTNPWIKKYIFPGGYIPSLSEIVPIITHAGFSIVDIEILRLHYADTLRAWSDRFALHRDEAARLYDERFCRIWEFYLAASEASFRYGGLVVFQLQLSKSLNAIPEARGYVERAEATLREIERRIY
ncbi:MAG: class I SAM-dependent methyltransferase [Hyphomicrobium sp.]|nr:cyclopropane-fatty-acyl-phospholipid synthase family protein [Hyphomicrobium sp.]RUP07787.1 MAG: class I SAM-dependent methyltransferase [Hyphomicrobium sp.]